jgi:hypothetical protein
MSTAPATPPKPQTVTITQNEAQTFKGFLKQLIVISRDGTWTEPDQRLRDLVDEVKTAFAKAGAASGKALPDGGTTGKTADTGVHNK